MAKAYWIATYFSVSNPDALAEYAKLAGPAISAGGGRFLARGNAAKAYEKGVKQRVVLIEFDSVDKAAAAHDSPGYQAALKVLGNAVEREQVFVDGLGCRLWVMRGVAARSRAAAARAPASFPILSAPLER